MAKSEARPKPAKRTSGEQSDRNNVQMAYNWIKAQILSGRFKAGETLPQGTLAKYCNTSRGPIREALRMLQNQGLIEAETNQRGRVASFTPRDLELTIASAIVNAGAAIARNNAGWSAAEAKRIEKLIDELETLGRAEAGTLDERRDLIAKRQHVYRTIVAELCAEGGAPALQILAGHFDRIAIFRQMASIRIGDVPEFPLAADLDDLRKAIRAGDSRAAAFAIIARMADLGRRGLDDMGEYQMGDEITAAVAFVHNALQDAPRENSVRQLRTTARQKVSVELKGKETLIWTFLDN